MIMQSVTERGFFLIKILFCFPVCCCCLVFVRLFVCLFVVVFLFLQGWVVGSGHGSIEYCCFPCTNNRIHLPK